jgi:cell division protein FtsI/penicillin-binding protein 2
VAGFRFELHSHYPQGPLAAHVLGLRTIDNEGRGGIEESRDEAIRGTDGVRRFVRDARGFVLDVLEEVTVAPRDGVRIRLSLDVLLQLIAERRLDRLMREYGPRGACAVLLDPRTGEVLALASRPGFDPNRPVDVPAEAWKNLAISAVFEPGSTFKPLVVAWALDRGLIRQDEIIDCEWGAYRMGRRILHDHHGYGDLTLTDVLVKSSNIGMAKIGERLGNPSLHDLAGAIGFGRATGIELPGEVAGILHPLEEWTSYSTGSIPMGQELAATPLQLIAAHAVLANGGARVRPHLILSEGAEEPVNSADAGRPLITELTSDWLVTGPLTEVIERGTGTKAKIKGYSVFGKTGTAQKTNVDRKGYSQTRHISSFVCGAPAENPAVLVLVMVDEPTRGDSQFGGIVAAPAAADILRDTLHYLQIGPQKSE